VVQLRYETIERGSESRLDRLFGLELIPQGAEFLSLVGRKQSKQPIRCGAFALCLVERTCCIVEIRITGVDLDNIVDENQLDHVRDIDRLIRIFAKNHRGQRKMPAVFGCIFGSVGMEKVGAPQDGFQFVDLEQKVDLFFQSLRSGLSVDCHWSYLTTS